MLRGLTFFNSLPDQSVDHLSANLQGPRGDQQLVLLHLHKAEQVKSNPVGEEAQLRVFSDMP